MLASGRSPTSGPARHRPATTAARRAPAAAAATAATAAAGAAAGVAAGAAARAGAGAAAGAAPAATTATTAAAATTAPASEQPGRLSSASVVTGGRQVAAQNQSFHPPPLTQSPDQRGERRSS